MPAPALKLVVDNTMPTPPLTSANSSPDEPTRSNWLSVAETAELLKISERAVQLNIANQKYQARAIQGSGGKSGINYEIHIASLPAEAQTQWIQSEALPEPEKKPTQINAINILNNAVAAHQIGEAQWRYGVIAAAIPHYSPAIRSTQCAEIVRQIAATPILHTHGKHAGQTRKISTSTIYEWLKRYVEGGIPALVDVTRHDKGKKRIIISRQWDALAESMGINADAATQIATEIEKYIAACWQQGASERDILQFSTTELKRLTQAAGGKKIEKSMENACAPSARKIRELKPLNKLAFIRNNDAKQYFDKIQYRNKRTLKDLLPNDIWFGDVHPVDIRMVRELWGQNRINLSDADISALQCAEKRGTEVYPSLIAWMDCATGLIFGVLFFPENRQKPTRLDVAKSFIAAVQAWGLPRTLYIDNGGEYNWASMLRGFSELSRIAPQNFDVRMDDMPSIINALPYNAPAKKIEGMFGVLEKTLFSKIEGWVGGKRMSKKTQCVGRIPRPFGGTEAELTSQITTALSFYNSRPQQGQLQGNSPIQAYRQAIALGWQPTSCSEDILNWAFADELQITIQAGGWIQFKQKGAEPLIYCGFCAEDKDLNLALSAGQKCNMRVPAHDPRTIWAQVPHSQKWVRLVLQEHTAFLDKNAAKKNYENNRALARQISEIENNTGGRLINWQEEFAKHTEPFPQVNAQAIQIVDEMRAALDAQMIENTKLPSPKKTPTFTRFGVEEIVEVEWDD